MERPLDAASGMNKGGEGWTAWRSGLAAAHAGRAAVRVEAEPLVTVTVLRPQEWPEHSWLREETRSVLGRLTQ